MRVLAIDLGKVRVGVAISDELGLLAHPRPYLDARDRRALWKALLGLADDEGVGRFLVGLPRTLAGAEGPPARRCRKFADELRERSGRPVELVDERLSTKEARGLLRESGLTDREQRTRIDSAAAAVLLQAWLDSRPAKADP